MFEVWDELSDLEVLEAEYIDNIYSDDLSGLGKPAKVKKGVPKKKPALKPKQKPIFAPVWQSNDPTILPPPPQAENSDSSATAIVTTPPFNPTINVDNNVSTDKWGWVDKVIRGGGDLISQWKGQPKEDFQVITDRQLPATVSGASADLDINGQGAGFKVNWLMIAGVVVVIAAVLYGMTKKGR